MSNRQTRTSDPLELRSEFPSGANATAVTRDVGLMIPSLPTTFGGLWIDTSRLMKLGPIQRFDTAGGYKWPILVPKIAALRGLVLGIEAVTIPPGPKLQLSTPMVVVIR